MDQFNKLDHYESRFSDQVWAGVSQHLEEQKKQKKKRRAFYLGATSVILLTAVIGYTSFSNDSAQSANRVGSQADQPAFAFTAGAESDQVNFFNPKQESSIILGDAQPEEFTKTKLIAETRKSGDNYQVTVSSQPGFQEEIYISEETVQVVTPSEIKQLRDTELRSQPQLNSQASIRSTSQKSTPINNSTLSSLNVNKFKQLKPLEEIDGLNQTLGLKPNHSIKSLFYREGCNLLEASPFKTYVWSQLSAFAPISHHSTKGSDSDAYRDVRQSTEKVLISPEFGFGVGVKSKEGYFIESGFQLSYYRERLGYVDPESINFQTIITTDSTIIAGEVEVTSDTITIQIPGSREVVNYNSHKTVSIPVIIGFDKQLSSSFSIGGKVGTIFNLFKESNGRILDRDMVVRDIIHNEGSVEVYKTRLSTQFFLGTQLRYHFSPSLDVYVSTDVRMTPKSITLETYSLNQRFTSPVLGAGMRYYF